MVSTERQKEKLLQLQSELATAKQEYEEFKELTKLVDSRLLILLIQCTLKVTFTEVMPMLH